MKKILFYISILCVLGSCTESVYDGTRAPSLNRRYLYVPTSSLSFDAQPSSKQVRIESEQTDWQISIPASWVSVSPSSGNTSASVDFATELNKSADISRVCVATVASNVSDWSRSFPITITQGKNSPYITFADNNISCSALQQSLTIELDANTEYTIDNTAESWLHIDSYDATAVKINVDENNTDNERIAVLTLKAKSYTGASATISVRQKKANIISTLEKITFEHSSSSQTLEVESEASWNASSTSWISVSPLSGVAGKTTVTISVPTNASVNSRNGSVYFTIAGNNSVEVPVEQEGVFLNVSAENISFDSFGTQQSLEVESNDSWSVTAKPEWVNIDNMSGERNATLRISALENNSTSERSGHVTIATDNGVVSKEIIISQAAKHVDYSDAALTYGYAQGSQDISFTTDGNWSLTKDSEWLVVDKTSGSGSATLTITVEENNTLDTRDGQISLLIADQSYTIAIHQECKYLTLSSSAFTFDAQAGSVQLSISSNTDWTGTISEGSDWIAITPASGTNNANMTISVAENKTVNNRSGKIEIEIPNVNTYVVEVLQNRKYIKTDMASVNFLNTGGQISFNVITDGTYEVSKIGTWFGFVKTGDVITIVASANETGTTRTGAIRLTLTNVEGTYSLLVPVTQAAESSSRLSVVNQTIKL